jgi:neutral ceramidase
MLSGTHTHSGPAGYAFYALYNIMSLGFYEDNFDVIVNGIVQAIKMAHENVSEGGQIYINEGELLDSNIRFRSWAFLLTFAVVLQQLTQPILPRKKLCISMTLIRI